MSKLSVLAVLVFSDVGLHLKTKSNGNLKTVRFFVLTRAESPASSQCNLLWFPVQAPSLYYLISI